MKYLKKFITDGVIDEFTSRTNMYHMQKQGKSLGVTTEEIQKLLGIHIEIGSMKCPQLHLYWGLRHYELIADSMTDNHFSILRNNVHIVDDLQPDPNSEDKLWKVCPIINAFLNGLAGGNLEKWLYVDEQMSPFNGTYTVYQ